MRKLSRGVFLCQDSIAVSETFDEYSRIVALPHSHYADVQNFSEEQILEAMNPSSPGNLDPEVEWDRKFVAWNFLSLETLRTIEYRQGIYSKTAKDALKWITLAVAAVHVFLEDDLDSLHAIREQDQHLFPEITVNHLLRKSANTWGFLATRRYLWEQCRDFLRNKGLRRPRTWPRPE